MRAALREHCPDQVDVYFDNVGGEILDAVLGHLALHGRVALCGAISVYNAEHRPPGPANYVNLINRRGRMQGFLSLDIVPRYGEIAMQLGTWVAEGKLTWREHIFDGLEQAPTALNAMFTGDNIGKILGARSGRQDPGSVGPSVGGETEARQVIEADHVLERPDVAGMSDSPDRRRPLARTDLRRTRRLAGAVGARS